MSDIFRKQEMLFSASKSVLNSSTVWTSQEASVALEERARTGYCTHQKWNTAITEFTFDCNKPQAQGYTVCRAHERDFASWNQSDTGLRN